MQSKQSASSKIITRFRQRLAYQDALPQLAILGIASGLVTGVFAVLFRLAVDVPLTLYLPDGDSENFEGLSTLWRFLLPVLGALTLALIWTRIRTRFRSTGVGHVLERVYNHQGRMPFGNAITQFIGGVLALITGQSAGREGPAVQIGATIASQFGRRLELPNNSLQTLVGCGVAAAIAASFNTPLAGVIFAMEVVLMEYTVAGFIPVILAAVSGTVLTRAVFGSAPAFTIPPLQLASLTELPYLALCGVAIGLSAAALLRSYNWLRKLQDKFSLWQRFLLAGTFTGVVALAVPQVMGIGYDTVEHAMLGEISLTVLLLIVAGKMATYCLSSAFGIPAGSIGPTLVIGAALGGALGVIGDFIIPGTAAGGGLYAILGMGAMMAAVLNAPLAALITIFELTANPNLLMPGMLTIVIATVCARMISKLPGIFTIGIEVAKMDSPVFRALSRQGVTSLMSGDFSSCAKSVSWNKANEILANRPTWLAVEELGETPVLLRGSSLANFLESEDTALWEPDHRINLLALPGTQIKLFPIHSRATLQEALIRMNEKQTDAIYVAKFAAPLESKIAGIITRDMVDNYYH